MAIAGKGEAPPTGDRRKQLSEMIGPHLWFGIGVFLRGFVVAFLAIGIIGSRWLIAGLTQVIVVLCRCTSAWLHVLTSFASGRSARLPAPSGLPSPACAGRSFLRRYSGIQIHRGRVAFAQEFWDHDDHFLASLDAARHLAARDVAHLRLLLALIAFS
jgi:hypothetical protein